MARQGQRKGDFLAGKYLLGDCIGIGGMGEVYRATNVSLGRDVAVKILSREYVDNEDDVLRFLREARAAAMIRHPNVVDVLDVARDDDGTPFIVQEFLSGEDLERYLGARGGRLSAVEALEIMIPVADAVGAAHEREVIHRDLKPANIFLSREGSKITPKVLDFGASRYATVGDLSTKELRMLIGTPHYMAPEQIISKTDVDARADVWALGIILYELLAGETPFEAETANAVLQLVKTREVPALSKVMKGATPELAELVARCTARDKTKRLPNAAKVADEMRDVRDRLRGSVRTRVDTAPEIDDAPAGAAHGGPPKKAALPANARIPSLFVPETSVAAERMKKAETAEPPPVPKKPPVPRREGPAKSALLTLSSPGSDPPPPHVDDAPAPKPAAPPLSESRRVDALRSSSGEYGELPLDELTKAAAAASPSPPSSRPNIAVDAQRAGSSESLPPRGEHELDRTFDDDDPPGEVDLQLGAPPSRDLPRDKPSSIPPVLDPRAAGRHAPPARATASVRPPAPLDLERRDAPREAPAAPPSTPALRTHTPAAELDVEDAPHPLPSSAKITLAASILSPAVLAFVALRILHLSAPLGRALRGDSMLASGILTVIVLVVAAVLSLKSVQGTRERALFVAAGGAVLFGIVMIIVTFTAGEPPDVADGPSGGIATWVAPIAPLAAAFAALTRARAVWTSRYETRERALWAAVASMMVLLSLELGPLGAARSAPRLPSPPPSAAPSP